MKLTFDKKEFYRAHLARDFRFDGKFFVAVKSTKIYCRPICPAKKALLKNLEFFLYAAQAEEAGYRPCLRCRPETAPTSAAWNGTCATVQRAVRMMDSLALEDLSVKTLAENLGIGERWLRDLFQQQVGASPQSILMTKKLDMARNLLDETTLSITEIAFSSGFQSLRRFNDAFKKRFRKTPSEVRKEICNVGLIERTKNQDKITSRVQLSYRPPYAWDKLLDFLKHRAIPNVELVDDNSYQRLIQHGDMRGWFKATLAPNNKIAIEFVLNKNYNLLELVRRLKNIFDLDADPMAIANSLQEDHKLKKLLSQYSGLRIAGGWDGFELAVRAVIGQQISVKAARTILGRLAEVCGEQQQLNGNFKVTRFFPTAEQILNTDLTKIGLPVARITTLKSLAEKVANKTLILDGTADYAKTCEQLLSIKGIGHWTMEYIAMRALRNPNAFPVTDLEIKKKITQLQLDPQKWSPWRAYAAILLWSI